MSWLDRLKTAQKAPADYRPEPKAWLSETGELRTQGVFDDLAGEIVRLTTDNLPLQKKLLLLHIEAFDRHHFPAMVEQWAERAAILQHEDGMSRQDAEQKAVEMYHLQAFLKELTIRES